MESIAPTLSANGGNIKYFDNYDVRVETLG